jgi:hypothetical protein
VRPGLSRFASLVFTLALAGCKGDRSPEIKKEPLKIEEACEGRCLTAREELNRLESSAKRAWMHEGRCRGATVDICRAGGGWRVNTSNGLCQRDFAYAPDGKVAWARVGCEREVHEYGTLPPCEVLERYETCARVLEDLAVDGVRLQIDARDSESASVDGVKLKDYADQTIAMGKHVVRADGLSLELALEHSAQKTGLRVQAKASSPGARVALKVAGRDRDGADAPAEVVTQECGPGESELTLISGDQSQVFKVRLSPRLR